MTDRPAPVAWAWSALAGAVAGFAALASASLVATLLSVDTPLTAVATRVIDAAPGSVKHWAVETLGKNDKLVLGIGVAVLLWGAATLMVRWSTRFPAVIPAGVIVFGLVGAISIRQHRMAAYLSVLIGAGVAWIVFRVLTPPTTVDAAEKASRDEVDDGALPRARAVAQPMPRHRWEAPIDRRQFVTRAAAVSAGSAAFGAIAVSVGHSRDIELRQAAGKLPQIDAASTDAAAPVSPDATVDPKVAPFITPNNRFYRIDTAFSSPRIDLAEWRLRIGGQVDRPLTLTFDDLLDRHVVERVVTLCCVSNEVGGDLIGTARWLGVPLAELLREASPHTGADQIAMTSADGWTCGFPTEIALDGRDAMVVVGMNGEPLPIDHGFPVRVVVPGLYGYVSATKWVTRIELTTRDAFDGYWVPLGWSKDGPVKTQSRIDVPKNGDDLRAGRRAIAGVAWAQHRGIRRVEVRVDDQPWAEARVGSDVSDDTWRQWIYEWDATPGSHKISVRATDGTGETQTGELAPPAPDGATGWHTIRVGVG